MEKNKKTVENWRKPWKIEENHGQIEENYGKSKENHRKKE